jgi:antirestriction protein ArdC
VLKEDSRFIFKAAAEAQKAADFILGKRAEE